jgi:hypothetical protein
MAADTHCHFALIVLSSCSSSGESQPRSRALLMIFCARFFSLSASSVRTATAYSAMMRSLRNGSPGASGVASVALSY